MVFLCSLVYGAMLRLYVFPNFYLAGLDLSANQEEVTDKETFQVEFDAESSKWHIRTAENRFWSLEQASGIQAGTGYVHVHPVLN